MFIRVIGLTRDAPLFHFAPTIDVDYPHPTRECERSLVVRFFRKGIVLGRWKESEYGTDEALKRFMRCGLAGESSAWGSIRGLRERGHSGLFGKPGGGTGVPGDDGAVNR